ncbi:hypothetical protein HK414_05105 [Ramlibacter terrae]|uniref:Uncharacterized protein n=1 Tax=Ramlibacter terrae TaxID=2732511 RepID=A0ABX6P2M2_9BURK|nr:hypothetical protein HK414_05105 [Ramlibacter terrae]
MLMGLWRFQLARGDMLAAREVAEALLRMAKRLENPGTLLGARMALGLTLLHLWDMPRGRELVLAGAEQCRAAPPDQRDIEIFSLGQHPPAWPA